jgi:hypothetical protein
MRRRTHQERKDESYDSLRAGGSTWQPDLGLWWSAEQMRTADGSDARFGEITAQKTLGAWAVSASGGGGSDRRLKPTSLYAGDAIRRFAAAGTTVFAGYTRNDYAADDPSSYHYYRLGLVQELPGQLRLSGAYHYVDNQVASGASHRTGSQATLALAATERRTTGTLGVLASCLVDVSRSPLCDDGGFREIYTEAYAALRYAAGPSYGFDIRSVLTTEGTSGRSRPAAVASEIAVAKTTARTVLLGVGGYVKL